MILQMVRDFYDEMGDKFPLPPAVDCLQYAVTEVGEVLDADLRDRRKHDNRRRKSVKSTVEEEIADVVMMLCAALIQYTGRAPNEVTPGGNDIKWLAMHTVTAYLKSDGNWRSSAYAALDVAHGLIDVPAMLQQRFDKIRSERLSKKEQEDAESGS